MFAYLLVTSFVRLPAPVQDLFYLVALDHLTNLPPSNLVANVF